MTWTASLWDLGRQPDGAARCGLNPGTSEPIFVLGASHSGTSLIKAELARHPLVYDPLPVSACSTCTGESELWKRHGTNEKYMYRILAEWTVGCLKRNAATWIEKTPSHLLCCTDAIRLRYPRARFVLMTRDPRDNLVSLLKRFESKDRKKGAPRNTSVARWTGLLAHYAAAAERTDDLPSSVVRRVRLEDLQADCANELGGVLRWLKLDYNASLHCSGSGASGRGLVNESRLGHIDLRRHQVAQLDCAGHSR